MKYDLNDIIDRRILYASVNTSAGKGDERWGLSIGPLYVGWYTLDGLYIGWIDKNDALRSFRELI